MAVNYSTVSGGKALPPNAAVVAYRNAPWVPTSLPTSAVTSMSHILPAPVPAFPVPLPHSRPFTPPEPQPLPSSPHGFLRQVHPPHTYCCVRYAPLPVTQYALTYALHPSGDMTTCSSLSAVNCDSTSSASNQQVEYDNVTVHQQQTQPQVVPEQPQQQRQIKNVQPQQSQQTPKQSVSLQKQPLQIQESQKKRVQQQNLENQCAQRHTPKRQVAQQLKEEEQPQEQSSQQQSLQEKRSNKQDQVPKQASQEQVSKQHPRKEKDQPKQQSTVERVPKHGPNGEQVSNNKQQHVSPKEKQPTREQQMSTLQLQEEAPKQHSAQEEDTKAPMSPQQQRSTIKHGTPQAHMSQQQQLPQQKGPQRDNRQYVHQSEMAKQRSAIEQHTEYNVPRQQQLEQATQRQESVSQLSDHEQLHSAVSPVEQHPQQQVNGDTSEADLNNNDNNDTESVEKVNDIEKACSAEEATVVVSVADNWNSTIGTSADQQHLSSEANLIVRVESTTPTNIHETCDVRTPCGKGSNKGGAQKDTQESRDPENGSGADMAMKSVPSHGVSPLVPRANHSQSRRNNNRQSPLYQHPPNQMTPVFPPPYQPAFQHQYSSFPPEHDPTNLYFANLPLSYKESDLERMLSKYGNIVSSRILRDMSNVSKGVGFARMETKEKCEKIIKALNGTTLPGSKDPILVKFADSSSKRRVYRGDIRLWREPEGNQITYDTSGIIPNGIAGPPILPAAAAFAAPYRFTPTQQFPGYAPVPAATYYSQFLLQPSAPIPQIDCFATASPNPAAYSYFTTGAAPGNVYHAVPFAAAAPAQVEEHVPVAAAPEEYYPYALK